MYRSPYQNHLNSNELYKKSNNNDNKNINSFQPRRAKSLDRASFNPRTTPLSRDKNLYYGYRPKGLQNIGATCYMNATLQCFFHVSKLTKYLSENKYTYDGIKIKPYSISSEYIKLIKELLYKNGQVDYAPYDFKEILGQKNPLFAGVAANDSKDLIMFILEELAKDLSIKKNKSIYGKNDEYDGFIDQTDERTSFKEAVKQFGKDVSIIKDLFYFMVKTESLCQNCKTKIYNFQVMNFIIFPLQKAYEDSLNMTNTFMLSNFMNSMNNMNSMNSMNNMISMNSMNNSMQSMNYNNSYNNNYGFGYNNYDNNMNIISRYLSSPSSNNRPSLNIRSNMSISNSNMSMDNNYSLSSNINSFQSYQNNNNLMNMFNLNNSNRNYLSNNNNNMLNNYNPDIKSENLLNNRNNYNRNDPNNRFKIKNSNPYIKNEEGNLFRKQAKTNDKKNSNFFSNNAQNLILGNNIGTNNNQNNFHFSNQQRNYNNNNNYNNYNNNFYNPNGNVPVRLMNGKGGYGPYDTLIQQKKVNRGPKLTLDQLFDSYLKPDFLTGDNKQYCNRCHVLSDSYYTTHIYSSPNILILVLNYGKGILFKCDVIFDEYINISKYIEAKNTNVPSRYRLLGAIVHIGPSSMGGHFIAFCRGIENKEKWFKLNDSLVSESTFSEIKSVGIPYVLFYENANGY